MPQMSPAMWEILYILETIIMIVTISKIYFILENKMNFSSVSKKLFNNKNWLW
uniref:ATP synthase F0 subunit 8 n=1 Tax=Ptenothrix huangshanensis TaxID=2583244 RepID=A0A6H0EYU6_9HEXA|nr:ATP synthase F0 subunit 8 [Ptenothrix huangshanensis]